MTTKMLIGSKRLQRCAARLVELAGSTLRVGSIETGELKRANSMGVMGAVFGFNANTAWIAQPCVPQTATCTHGFRYQRRPQERLT